MRGILIQGKKIGTGEQNSGASWFPYAPKVDLKENLRRNMCYFDIMERNSTRLP